MGDEIKDTFKCIKSLKYLKLNNVKGLDTSALKQIGEIKSLKKLKMCGYQLCYNYQLCCCLSLNEQLEELVLKDSKISVEDLKSIEGLVQLKKLVLIDTELPKDSALYFNKLNNLKCMEVTKRTGFDLAELKEVRELLKIVDRNNNK